MSKYTITLSDGSISLDFYSLETNGPGTNVTRRTILSTNNTGDVGAHYFRLSGDIAGRFIGGFTFIVVDSSGNDGTFTVASGGAEMVPLTQTINAGTPEEEIIIIDEFTHVYVVESIPDITAPFGDVAYTVPGLTSVLIPGRGSLNYGHSVVTSTIHMLENFAAPTQPENMLAGQLWYDTFNGSLRLLKTAGGVLDGILLTSGDTAFTGDLDMGTNKIINLVTGTDDNDAVTRKYVDDTFVDVAGDTMTGNIIFDPLKGITSLDGASILTDATGNTFIVTAGAPGAAPFKINKSTGDTLFQITGMDVLEINTLVNLNNNTLKNIGDPAPDSTGDSSGFDRSYADGRYVTLSGHFPLTGDINFDIPTTASDSFGIKWTGVSDRYRMFVENINGVESTRLIIEIADNTDDYISFQFQGTQAVPVVELVTIKPSVMEINTTLSMNKKITFASRTAVGEIGLDLSNNDIIGVNRLVFSDPGFGEGITWAGGNDWSISEASDDLISFEVGNLQFVQAGTRVLTINTTKQLDIPVATGTAPFVIASTTKVDNLNVDFLDGFSSADFSKRIRTESGTISAGWYTIAINFGDRASAKFIIADQNSGRHASVHFYATHMHGTDAANTLTVLSDASYNVGSYINKIRILDGGTYDGSMLQVYVDGTGLFQSYIYENEVTSGWQLRSWIPDGVDPGGLSNYSVVVNENATIYLGDDNTVGINTTQEMLIKNNKVWHAGNDGDDSGLDADKLGGIDSSDYARTDIALETFYAGTNTTLEIRCHDDGAAKLKLYGTGAGTGQLYVGQSIGYGGGIEYNGDNNPLTSGAGADYLALYRKNLAYYWTARNHVNDNNWEFRDEVTVKGHLRISTAGKGLYMNNGTISGVANLIINDPGPNEGIEWNGGSGWKIYESPNNLTTNVGGNLQFVLGSTRVLTINTSKQLDITVAAGTAPFIIASNTKVDNLNSDTVDGIHAEAMSWGTQTAHGAFSDFNSFRNSSKFGGYYVHGDVNGPGVAGEYYHTRLSAGIDRVGYALQTAIPGEGQHYPYVYIRYENPSSGFGSWMKTWAGNSDKLQGYVSASLSTASTVVRRDSNKDIQARLFRSEYDSTNPTIGFIMTQVDTASNNYIRPSTPLQFRAAVTDGSYAPKHSHPYAPTHSHPYASTTHTHSTSSQVVNKVNFAANDVVSTSPIFPVMEHRSQLYNSCASGFTWYRIFFLRVGLPGTVKVSWQARCSSNNGNTYSIIVKNGSLYGPSHTQASGTIWYSFADNVTAITGDTISIYVRRDQNPVGTYVRNIFVQGTNLPEFYRIT